MNTRHLTYYIVQLTTDNGERTTDNGEQTTGNGEQATGNGQRKTENGKLTTDTEKDCAFLTKTQSPHNQNSSINSVETKPLPDKEEKSGKNHPSSFTRKEIPFPGKQLLSIVSQL